MNTQQRNRYLMLKNVSEWLAKHVEKFTGMPAVIFIITQFNEVLGRIEAIMNLQETAAIGKTSKKTEAIESLIAVIMPIRAVVYVLARTTGRAEARANAEVQEWELRSMRHSELLERAERIHRDAVGLGAEIATYGITEEKLQAVGAAIDALRVSMHEKESGVAERIGARYTLVNLLAQAEDLLTGQLDHLIDLFRDSDPVFYEGYWASRSTRNLGVRHEQPAPAPGTDTPPVTAS
jgi:hypothetical protein